MERISRSVFFSCAAFSVFVTASIIAVLGYESFLFFRQVPFRNFIFDTQWTPLFVEKHFGISPLLCGTLLTSVIALLVALPLGLIIAVYLSEFASSHMRAAIKPSLETLAGIPTVVYGYFALLFVTPFLQRLFPELGGFNALSPGLVMGLMILPMIVSMSDDALHAVPVGMREAAYALGSSKMQMIFRVLVPCASGGIAAAFILALSRAVGETMIVTIAAGQQPNLTLSAFEPVETMTAYIVQISLGDTPHGTLEFQTLFAVAATLFVLTFAFNSISLWLRVRYYKTFRV